jgi:PAS domain S-box-containing protein
MTAPVRRVLTALIILYLAGYLTWLAVGTPDGNERLFAGNLALIVPSAICAWYGLRAWRTPAHPSAAPARRAWGWLWLGAVFWLSGDVLRLVLEAFPGGPLAEWNFLDILFGLGSLALLTGLLLYPRREMEQRPHRRLRVLLDATVATTAILCLAWIQVLAPIASADHPTGALLYPVAGLILLLVTMNLFLVFEPGSYPPALAWLSLAITAYAVSDLTYASILRQRSYQASSLIDFGWVIGDGLFVCAAVAQVSPSALIIASPPALTRQIAKRAQSLIPLIATLALGWVTLLNWQPSGPTAQLGPWATVVLSLVIIARQGIAAGELEYEKYVRLFDSIAEPAFICDRGGRLRLVNPAFLQLTGYTQSRMMVGLPLQLLVRPSQNVAAMLSAGLQELREGPTGWNGLIEICRVDGSLVPTQLSLRPVDWGGGSSAVAGTAHDLSEIHRQQVALQQTYRQLAQTHAQLETLNSQLEQRVAEKTADLKQAYEQLEIQNAALVSLDRLKSDFVSLVSHELRAPLTNINGGIELVLARSRPLAPDARETLTLVQAEIDRLTRFVETILDLSALDAGRAPIYPAPLRLAEFSVLFRAQMRHIPGMERICWEIPPDAPEVLADERAIHSVLFHLLDNALKYAPAGLIRVSAGTEGAGGWVKVEDEGDGIPPEDISMIFSRFYRSRGGDSQTVYGHGLGLYIVRKLLDAMNGTIEAENRAEGGACFTFRLPLVVEEHTGEGYEL